MGVKGRRIKKDIGEPTLLGDIYDIIEEAKNKRYISEYRVDVESLMNEYKIEVVKENLPSTISGYLKKEGDIFVIAVNKKHHIKRQRFTIAHEFAHFCLHQEDDEYFEDTTFFRKEDDSSLEYKANEFAAELLMPEELFRDAINSGMVKFNDLANAFDVSVLAIKYRAKSLGYNIKSYE